jgi:hypothetical protein
VCEILGVIRRVGGEVLAQGDAYAFAEEAFERVAHPADYRTVRRLTQVSAAERRPGSIEGNDLTFFPGDPIEDPERRRADVAFGAGLDERRESNYSNAAATLLQVGEGGSARYRRAGVSEPSSARESSTAATGQRTHR